MDVSELRPSPLELIFVLIMCAPCMAGTGLATGVSGSSSAIRFVGGGALW